MSLDNLTFDPHILAIPRAGSWMSKEDVRQKYGLDTVYRMSFNESPLGPSPKVVQAIQETAASLGDYPDFSDERLRQALADHVGRGLTAEHFFTGSSGFEALELVGRAFIRPGDECLVSHPTFGVYDRIITMQGGRVVDVPLRDDFSLDVDSLLTAVTERTRLLVLCNPNNPTGTYTPAAEIDRLVRHLPDHVLIVADEVYFHFATAENFPDTLQYILQERPVVLIHTFSKAYGLAGLRLGYGIAPPKIADYVARLHRGFHQSALALAAGIAAVADQDHLQKNVQAALEGKQWLYEQLDALDVAYIPSQTNFFVVETPIPAAEVSKQLEPLGVLVRPMASKKHAHHLRVTATIPEGNQRFIEGLKQILEKREN